VLLARYADKPRLKIPAEYDPEKHALGHWTRAVMFNQFGGRAMVLPDRIELSTSSLPMKCSTTELRQQVRRGINKKSPLRRAILATRPWAAQALAGPGSFKSPDDQPPEAAACFIFAN